jgi:hypothetical protein
MKIARGVPLVTLLKPDMSWRRVRGYQSTWGQKVKGKKGGRPTITKAGYKKQRRSEKMPMVIKLYEQGKRISAVARLVQVPRSTVNDWIKKRIYF